MMHRISITRTLRCFFSDKISGYSSRGMTEIGRAEDCRHWGDQMSLFCRYCPCFWSPVHGFDCHWLMLCTSVCRWGIIDDAILLSIGSLAACYQPVSDVEVLSSSDFVTADIQWSIKRNSATQCALNFNLMNCTFYNLICTKSSPTLKNSPSKCWIPILLVLLEYCVSLCLHTHSVYSQVCGK